MSKPVAAAQSPKPEFQPAQAQGKQESGAGLAGSTSGPANEKPSDVFVNLEYERNLKELRSHVQAYRKTKGILFFVAGAKPFGARNFNEPVFFSDAELNSVDYSDADNGTLSIPEIGTFRKIGAGEAFGRYIATNLLPFKLYKGEKDELELRDDGLFFDRKPFEISLDMAFVVSDLDVIRSREESYYLKIIEDGLELYRTNEEDGFSFGKVGELVCRLKGE
ncbi:MAG: hypothetical protein WCL50_04005 [Spirochaetota bacterium]